MPPKQRAPPPRPLFSLPLLQAGGQGRHNLPEEDTLDASLFEEILLSVQEAHDLEISKLRDEIAVLRSQRAVHEPGREDYARDVEVAALKCEISALKQELMDMQAEFTLEFGPQSGPGTEENGSKGDVSKVLQECREQADVATAAARSMQEELETLRKVVEAGPPGTAAGGSQESPSPDPAQKPKSGLMAKSLAKPPASLSKDSSQQEQEQEQQPEQQQEQEQERAPGQSAEAGAEASPPQQEGEGEGEAPPNLGFDDLLNQLQRTHFLEVHDLRIQVRSLEALTAGLDAGVTSVFDPVGVPPLDPEFESTADSWNRNRDKARVEGELRLREQGDKVTLFADPKDPTVIVARGYRRVLYGDHGPYLELDHENIRWESFPYKYIKGFRAYYNEYYTATGFVKVYDQKKTVGDKPNPPGGRWSARNNRVATGYADYQPGRIYIPCDNVLVVRLTTPCTEEANIDMASLFPYQFQPPVAVAPEEPAAPQLMMKRTESLASVADSLRTADSFDEDDAASGMAMLSVRDTAALQELDAALGDDNIVLTRRTPRQLEEAHKDAMAALRLAFAGDTCGPDVASQINTLRWNARFKGRLGGMGYRRFVEGHEKELVLVSCPAPHKFLALPIVESPSIDQDFWIKAVRWCRRAAAKGPADEMEEWNSVVANVKAWAIQVGHVVDEPASSSAPAQQQPIDKKDAEAVIDLSSSIDEPAAAEAVPATLAATATTTTTTTTTTTSTSILASAMPKASRGAAPVAAAAAAAEDSTSTAQPAPAEAPNTTTASFPEAPPTPERHFTKLNAISKARPKPMVKSMPTPLAMPIPATPPRQSSNSPPPPSAPAPAPAPAPTSAAASSSPASAPTFALGQPTSKASPPSAPPPAPPAPMLDVEGEDDDEEGNGDEDLFVVDFEGDQPGPEAGKGEGEGEGGGATAAEAEAEAGEAAEESTPPPPEAVAPDAQIADAEASPAPQEDATATPTLAKETEVVNPSLPGAPSFDAVSVATEPLTQPSEGEGKGEEGRRGEPEEAVAAGEGEAAAAAAEQAAVAAEQAAVAENVAAATASATAAVEEGDTQGDNEEKAVEEKTPNPAPAPTPVPASLESIEGLQMQETSVQEVQEKLDVDATEGLQMQEASVQESLDVDVEAERSAALVGALSFDAALLSVSMDEAARAGEEEGTQDASEAAAAAAAASEAAEAEAAEAAEASQEEAAVQPGEAQIQADIQVEAQVEAQIETETQAESGVQSEGQAEIQAEIQAQTQVQSEILEEVTERVAQELADSAGLDQALIEQGVEVEVEVEAETEVVVDSATGEASTGEAVGEEGAAALPGAEEETLADVAGEANPLPADVAVADEAVASVAAEVAEELLAATEEAVTEVTLEEAVSETAPAEAEGADAAEAAEAEPAAEPAAEAAAAEPTTEAAADLPATLPILETEASEPDQPAAPDQDQEPDLTSAPTLPETEGTETSEPDQPTAAEETAAVEEALEQGQEAETPGQEEEKQEAEEQQTQPEDQQQETGQPVREGLAAVSTDDYPVMEEEEAEAGAPVATEGAEEASPREGDRDEGEEPSSKRRKTEFSKSMLVNPSLPSAPSFDGISICPDGTPLTDALADSSADSSEDPSGQAEAPEAAAGEAALVEEAAPAVGGAVAAAGEEGAAAVDSEIAEAVALAEAVEEANVPGAVEALDAAAEALLEAGQEAVEAPPAPEMPVDVAEASTDVDTDGGAGAPLDLAEASLDSELAGNSMDLEAPAPASEPGTSMDLEAPALIPEPELTVGPGEVAAADSAQSAEAPEESTTEATTAAATEAEAEEEKVAEVVTEAGSGQEPGAVAAAAAAAAAAASSEVVGGVLEGSPVEGEGEGSPSPGVLMEDDYASASSSPQAKRGAEADAEEPAPKRPRPEAGENSEDVFLDAEDETA